MKNLTATILFFPAIFFFSVQTDKNNAMPISKEISAINQPAELDADSSTFLQSDKIYYSEFKSYLYTAKFPDFNDKTKLEFPFISRSWNSLFCADDNYLYFISNVSMDSSLIFKAPLNGSKKFEKIVNITQSYRFGQTNHNPRNITVGSNALYWIDSYPDAIYSCDLDGKNVKKIMSFSSLQGGFNLAAHGNKVYFIIYLYGHAGFTGVWIQSVNKDGNEHTKIIDQKIIPSGSNAFCVNDNYLFWVTQNGIHRADLDGSGEVLLIDSSKIKGLPGESIIDITSSGNRLFWSGLGDGIGIADTDGRNIRQLKNKIHPSNFIILQD
jgi:hypothetical protein